MVVIDWIVENWILSILIGILIISTIILIILIVTDKKKAKKAKAAADAATPALGDVDAQAAPDATPVVDAEAQPLEPDPLAPMIIAAEEKPLSAEPVSPAPEKVAPVAEKPKPAAKPKPAEKPAPAKPADKPVAKPAPVKQDAPAATPAPAAKPSIADSLRPGGKVAVKKGEPVKPATTKAPAAKPAAKPAPVKPAPIATPDEDEADIPGDTRYHVSQSKDIKTPNYGRWRVRKSGSTKTIQFFDTQKAAIEYAKQLADTAGTSVVIHKRDGKIRKQDYSNKE